MTAFEILQALQKEVGSRRAGTEGELRAQEWIRARCESLGLPVELDEFTFVGAELYRPLVQLGILILAAASFVLGYLDRPLAAGLCLLILAGYMNYGRKWLEVRMARARSHNIIAGLRRTISEYIAGPDKGPAVLLCAHYDTPYNSPAWTARLRGVMQFVGPLGLLGLMANGLFLALRGVGALLALVGTEELAIFLANINLWVVLVLAILTAPLLLVMFVRSVTMLGRKSDSPGADDNGSGTSVVLDVAHRLAQIPPDNLEVFFAWWGAEELGLFGSRQFVRRFGTQLDKDLLHVINVDCVGVGELLTICSGKGLISRKPANAEVVARLDRITAQLDVPTIHTWESIVSGGSSDHAEWMDRGYGNAFSLLRGHRQRPSLPARVFATLMRLPDANQLDLPHIHMAQDTIAVIDPEILAQTADVAEAYVRELDQGA